MSHLFTGRQQKWGKVCMYIFLLGRTYILLRTQATTKKNREFKTLFNHPGRRFIKNKRSTLYSTGTPLVRGAN